MGENCNICDGVSILNSANISLGDRVSIHENTTIGGKGKITIGNHVAIAHNCSIISESHIFSDNDILIKDQGLTTEPIFIGNNVWLGCKVAVLGNVRIGNGCVIGAGSVVTKDIPENTVAVGNPCRVIRYRNKKE